MLLLLISSVPIHHFEIAGGHFGLIQEQILLLLSGSENRFIICCASHSCKSSEERI